MPVERAESGKLHKPLASTLAHVNSRYKNALLGPILTRPSLLVKNRLLSARDAQYTILKNEKVLNFQLLIRKRSENNFCTFKF